MRLNQNYYNCPLYLRLETPFVSLTYEYSIAVCRAALETYYLLRFLKRYEEKDKVDRR